MPALYLKKTGQEFWKLSRRLWQPRRK